MGYSFSVTIHGALLSLPCLFSIMRIPLERMAAQCTNDRSLSTPPFFLKLHCRLHCNETWNTFCTCLEIFLTWWTLVRCFGVGVYICYVTFFALTTITCLAPSVWYPPSPGTTPLGRVRLATLTSAAVCTLNSQIEKVRNNTWCSACPEHGICSTLHKPA